MRVPGLATDSRISSACSNKHCTAHWALWAVSAAELPSQHQHQQPQVQKAALSSLAFLAQPRCQVGRRIPRYVATARSGDFSNTTASLRSVTSSAGEYESPASLAPVLCTSVLQLLRRQHMLLAARAFRQGTKQIIGMLYRRRLPIEPSTNPRNPQPLLSTHHWPRPDAPLWSRPEVGSAGWTDCRRFCLPRHPPILPRIVLVLPDWIDVDKSCRRAPRRFNPIIFGLKRPRSLCFRTRSVNPLLPAPPRPAPAWSPSLFPAIPRLFGGSLADCHNFVRYTLYPVGIWLFLRHLAVSAAWTPSCLLGPSPRVSH